MSIACIIFTITALHYTTSAEVIAILNQKRVLLSVIIPAYNSERYIEKCLRSVIGQSIDDIEVILIDNDSEDHTREIAERLLKNSKKVYRIVTNPVRGVSYSRNMGLKLAQGEYIFFLDSDDYLVKENALDLAIKTALENQLDVVHFGFNRVKEDGKLLLPYSRLYRYLKRIEKGKDVLTKYLSGRVWFWMGNAIYKRSLIERHSISFTEGAFAGEDQEFIAKCLFHAERVCSIKEVFTNYVIHDFSLSSKGIELLAAVDAFERLLNYLQNSSDSDVERIRSLIVHHKIPYLILRAIYKSARRGTPFEMVWERVRQEPYLGYLKGAKLTGLSTYEVVTAILSKLFLTFPKFTYALMRALSERGIAFG